MAWLNGWSYRKSHIISQTVDAGTNYQVLIKVYYGDGEDGTEVIGSTTSGKIYCDSKCKTDFGDLRFTEDDGETELDYWIEEQVNEDYALIWVEISGDLDAGNVSIYAYYGNTEATTTSNGFNTFSFFDDFNDGVLGAWWTVSVGTPVEANGYLRVEGAGGVMDDVRSTNAYGTCRFKCKSRAGGVATNAGWQIGMRLLNDSEYIIFSRAAVVIFYIRDWDGAATQTLIAEPSLNVWHDYEMLYVKSTSTNYYIDDVLSATHITNNPDNDLYTRFVSYSNNPPLDIEWAFIAKYVSPEPVHGDWGEEETPPAAGAVAGFSIVPILQGIGILK